MQHFGELGIDSTQYGRIGIEHCLCISIAQIVHILSRIISSNSNYYKQIVICQFLAELGDKIKY